MTADDRPGRRRLPGLRVRRVDLLVALLLAALGFAAAVQVRSTRTDGVLASARPDDLVRILDDLSGRDARLRQEITDLTTARERLTSAGGGAAALADAQRRTQVLGVLAGTVPASGPGITLTVEDPRGVVRADVLLDALEELRDAGAEAVQLAGSGAPPVRVVASTALVDRPGGVTVDGVPLAPPYTFTVLGDTGTLRSALGIPGGVVATVARVGGTARVDPSTALTVGALRQLTPPRYARPATGG
jgi:uncharacterized protein YlxW (UPF0749 family)